MTALTQTLLQEALDYDAAAGTFVWRERPSHHFNIPWSAATFNAQFAGRKAGRVSKNGYHYIHICGTKRLAHRLAWMYVHGEMPDGEVDHINRCRTDNRISNLRVVTRRENSLNCGTAARCNSKSGVRGVSWSKKSKKWLAQITSFGRVRPLGVFENIADAQAVYQAAQRELHVIREDQ